MRSAARILLLTFAAAKAERAAKLRAAVSDAMIDAPTLPPGSDDTTLTHMRKEFATAFPGGGIDRRVGRLLVEFARRDRDVYQFGVFTGNGLKKIAGYCSGRCGHVWGFDSFQGIPAESGEESQAWRHGAHGKYKTHFLEGGYSAAAALGDTSMRSVMRKVAARVGHPEQVTLIGGYFNETCNDMLLSKHRLQPALHVDMDADIYLSAMQALDWMFAHKLIVPGTFLRYDDYPRINATHGAAKGTNLYGQARAHYELSEKWDVTWQLVAAGTVQALSIGAERCETYPGCKRATSFRESLGLSDSSSPSNRDSGMLLPLWSPAHTRPGLSRRKS